MLTEDFLLPTDGSWLVIPLTSTSTSIFNNSPVQCSIRLGSTSQSKGIKVPVGATVLVDETCYVKAEYTSSGTSYITVTR